LNKLFNILLGCLIFFSATAYQIGKSFAEVQGMVFLVGIPLLFIVSLYLKPKRWVVNPFVNLISAIGLIAMFFVPKDGQAIVYQPLINVFMGTGLFYLITNYLDDFNVILKAISWVVGFTAIIVFLQVTGNDPICINDSGLHNYSMVGLFGFKYVFGAYMAICTPILLLKKKLLGLVALALTICSLSWACIGLAILATIFGAWFVSKSNKVFIAIIIFALILSVLVFRLVLYTPDNYKLQLKYKITARIETESKFLPVLMMKPYYGWGLGTFKIIGPQIVNGGKYGDMVDAWNDYLERSVEMGIGAIILMIWLFVNAFKRFFRYKIEPAVFASLAIVPFGIAFHNYFNHFSLVVLIISLFAWWEAKNIKEEIGG
jgi:hypothetical protein